MLKPVSSSIQWFFKNHKSVNLFNHKHMGYVAKSMCELTSIILSLCYEISILTLSTFRIIYLTSYRKCIGVHQVIIKYFT